MAAKAQYRIPEIVHDAARKTSLLRRPKEQKEDRILSGSRGGLRLTQSAMEQQSELDSAPRLRPEAAFLIQMRSDTEFESRQLRGRVEHVRSGDSAPFSTLEDLLAFL